MRDDRDESLRENRELIVLIATQLGSFHFSSIQISLGQKISRHRCPKIAYVSANIFPLLRKFQGMGKTFGHPKFHGCKNYSVSQKFSGIGPKIPWVKNSFVAYSKIFGHWSVAQKFQGIGQNPMGDKLFCGLETWA